MSLRPSSLVIDGDQGLSCVLFLGQAEFEAEQEYIKTLSMLSEDEQRKYKERQSISFLYMKPPGYDAALQRSEEAKKVSTLISCTL